MNGLGRELKEMTAADIPALWGNIERIRERGALYAGSLASRTAASYAVLAVEQRIGAIMAEGLPTPPPRDEMSQPAVVGETVVVELPAAVLEQPVSAGVSANS
jgi:hypothetical protein